MNHMNTQSYIIIYIFETHVEWSMYINIFLYLCTHFDCVNIQTEEVLDRAETGGGTDGAFQAQVQQVMDDVVKAVIGTAG